MTKRGCVTTAAGLAGLLTGLTPARVVRAADDSSLPGLDSRVRVTASASRSGPLTGTLTGIDEKSLAVLPEGRSEAVVLERQDIRRVEWSVRPSRKKKGALLGLGIGFGAGLVGTFLLCDAYGTGCPAGEGAVFGTFYGSLLGAVGAGVGALVAPGERWTEVALDRLGPGDGLKQPRPRVHLSVVPMVGARRGLAIVGSFR